LNTRFIKILTTQVTAVATFMYTKNLALGLKTLLRPIVTIWCCNNQQSSSCPTNLLWTFANATMSFTVGTSGGICLVKGGASDNRSLTG